MQKETIFWKTLKKQQSIYSILFVIFLYTTFSSAETIKPNIKIDPYQVVIIQLNSLKNNDNPVIDSGIEQTWEFAHPDNKINTGPLEKFKKMIKGDAYKMLLNHLDHEIIQEKVTESKALFEVRILDKNKSYFKFKWQVERYKEEGPLLGCWLTTAVSSPAPLGSSI
jgi:hypothetical protein